MAKLNIPKDKDFETSIISIPAVDGTGPVKTGSNFGLPSPKDLFEAQEEMAKKNEISKLPPVHKIGFGQNRVKTPFL